MPKMNNTHSIKLSAIKVRNTTNKKNGKLSKKNGEKHKKQRTESTSQSVNLSARPAPGEPLGRLGVPHW